MKRLQHIECEDAIRRIKFAHDGLRFLAIGRRQIVSYRLDGTREGVSLVTRGFFDADYVDAGRVAVSTLLPEQHHALVLYDLFTGGITAGVETNDIRSVCVDPNRRRILTGGLTADGNGGYLDSYDFSLQRMSRFGCENPPFDMVISHTGNHAAVASIFFELWDTTQQPYPRLQNYPPERDCTGYICEVNAVDITPDGRFALGGLYGGKAACFLVDVNTGDITDWYGPDGTVSFVDTVAAALSPDASYVAVALRDATSIAVYRTTNNSLFHQFEVSNCQTLAFSPRGDRLAFGGENFVSLWEFNRESTSSR